MSRTFTAPTYAALIPQVEAYTQTLVDAGKGYRLRVSRNEAGQRVAEITILDEVAE